MSDVFSSECYFSQSTLNGILHFGSPVENGDSLLVLIGVDFDLIQQLFVDQFIFVDQAQ